MPKRIHYLSINNDNCKAIVLLAGMCQFREFVIGIFVQFVLCMQDKLQLLAGHHVDILETLSPNVRKRVELLRDLQV